MRLLVGVAAFVAVPARGACPTPHTTADLAAAIEEAKSAYVDVEVEAFRAATERARTVLPCLTDEVTRHLAAELHRQEGLAAFVERDRERAGLAFAAARALEPESTFPTSLAPPGHPVARSYEEAVASTEVVAVAAPLSGHVSFDGVAVPARPVGRSTVVQLADGVGRVTHTAYLWPDDPMPAYEVQVEPVGVTTVDEGRTATAAARRRARPLWIGAGVSAVAAAVLFGANVAVHQTYEDPDTPIEDLDQLRATNNALVVASAVGLGGAIGFGVTALTVRF